MTLRELNSIDGLPGQILNNWKFEANKRLSLDLTHSVLLSYASILNKTVI